MKTHKLIQLGMLATVISATGCASIVSHSKWPVSFKSDPPGAEVVITDDSGKEVHRGTTPVIFKLPSGAGFFSSQDYAVDMKLAGYQEDKSVLKAGLNGWYAGNLVFGGLIGLLIVDPITGAMWRLPSQHNINLAPNSATSSGANSVSQK